MTSLNIYFDHLPQAGLVAFREGIFGPKSQTEWWRPHLHATSTV